ncbi:S8 family serine peptidase [Thermaerobacter subterraneus]|uniref:Subtilisin-like serine protease n=1 Tax=Thermaerobacter subterraneus DSM 13965 TaxID=867903 RepID=K6Q0H4_9FIRM|nr:S8 family serine peptidase [Thermaerobacter subterraneus]EKP94404.1 subtilisin-like serine protease [Thermaerobacter subterraneus DSM 13965]
MGSRRPSVPTGVGLRCRSWRHRLAAWAAAGSLILLSLGQALAAVAASPGPGRGAGSPLFSAVTVAAAGAPSAPSGPGAAAGGDGDGAAASGKEPARAGWPAGILPVLTDTDGDRVSQDLEDWLAQASPGDRQAVIVRLRPGTLGREGGVHRLVGRWQAAVGSFAAGPSWQHALEGFAARLTPGQIRALAQQPEVAVIEPDRPVRAHLGTATTWTGVRQAWSDFGVTGDRDGRPTAYSRTDVVIAVIDTGIDATHVDLDGGKVIGWYDAVRGRTTPYDDNGHGTHVASIAAGTGEGNAAYTGVAPGAALVGIKVLNQQGSGTTSQILSGIDWMVRNKDTYGIRIGNMSLGAAGCSDGTDSLSTAVNNAVAAGIVMMVAAGNEGPNRCTIGTPGAAAGAVTVGAVYDPGERGWVLAEFSSRGPTADGRVKPDVTAPGRNITAAKAGSTTGYVTYSGTSMATPFIAGTAALMLDANYGLTPSQVKNLLTASGNVKDFGPGGKDIDWGAGISIAYNAVKAAGGYSGSFSDGLQHAYWAGSLSGSGDGDLYSVTVTDATRPLGLTMNMASNPSCGLWSCSPDFDLYLYDPAGRLVARSEGTARQEQILYQPSTTGTYRVEVYSYAGAGSYHLDTSYR